MVDLQLTVLGCATPYPAADNPCSGYLVTSGAADRLAGFLTNGPRRSPIESAFEITELYDGQTATVGGVELTSRAVEHGLPAFGVRVEGAGRSLVYSGDTAPCAALSELADGCDVLLCEAGGDDPAHHTAEQAGDSAAGAGRLIVTHVARPIAPAEAAARAATRYDGPVEYAVPGATYRM
ncbi:hypothetical protein GCM10009630_30910 [Kribbella jejuensis]|uniref:Beta-lactamase family protein n=1 Tax=Kribbella jejuensis TaxID=236068 RepID=A0A542EM68_9ACTN|nr:MBL fold metallo-hydrolase [Kribbella jejuensis]TQJ16450.1 beta-lactamase family protein [Kribbella jejuensis]